jgi:hydrocephalus-inducing protein
MYATRNYKFAIKNISEINMNYHFRIVSAKDGTNDSGPFSISPKKGVISPGCDETFVVKFSPLEIEKGIERLLSCKVQHLDPEAEPLIIELSGVVERPIVHFELPASSYKEKKAKDMTPIDSKYHIIEFESLGTKVKNIKRFMVVNPTSQGYEFEWEETEGEKVDS